MSELFLRTLRDDPPTPKFQPQAADQGRLRPAGRTRVVQLAAAGLRVLRRIEAIVREEMTAIGGQEIPVPALLPRAPYETTNRWDRIRRRCLPAKDRRDNDYLLGPTHEELFTLTVKGDSSYKDFRRCCSRSRPNTGTRHAPGPASPAAASSS